MVLDFWQLVGVVMGLSGLCLVVALLGRWDGRRESRGEAEFYKDALEEASQERDVAERLLALRALARTKARQEDKKE